MKHIKISLGILLVSSLLYSAPDRNSAFEAGRRQFDGGNYDRAIELLSQVITGSNDPNVKSRAYYFQGLSFFEKGLYFSSFISFRNVLLAADERNKEIGRAHV